jgi:hypothetical protein
MAPVAELDADRGLARVATATDWREDLERDLDPGDVALDQLQVLGDRKSGSGGHQQAQEGDRRENPLQSPPILRASR